ncbi:MAG: 16S rRNA (guanine(527)-N(7))-methyltransferase RsmG [Bacteroidales bacterium]|nr:16S rRNA (guanine(527)-N(7))-methyltransferase RsmG [Bacteroidales bacterium]MDY6427557.1 16S rRNA (guanine(527)-N(7))-methyltransferase RsmG [Bacteroidales bacterium]
MTNILKYFPNLTAEQIERFSALDSLYRDWNSKINVISRKDIDNLYEHHVLHSLAIAKILRFQPGTDVVDIGTGGGFPGIPLAIMFPECNFTLVDSVGKKIKVASEVAASLGLNNVNFVYDRMENFKQKFDFAVSRAAMSLDMLVKVCRKNINKAGHNALPNGLICLKGGELETEVKAYSRIATLYSVSDFFSEEYFQTKKAVYLPL